MENQMEIEFAVANDKLRSTANSILTQVLKLLKELSALEREFFERNKKLEEKKLEAGISPNQTAPGKMELWQEYSEQYKRLVTPMCTERLLKRGYARSFGKPGKYDFLHEKCKIVCAMKSPKKATIETSFHSGIDQRVQFIIKNIDNEWKIDVVNYAFSNETTWHVDQI